jgi:hypothetical protein
LSAVFDASGASRLFGLSAGAVIAIEAALARAGSVGMVIGDDLPRGIRVGVKGLWR